MAWRGTVLIALFVSAMFAAGCTLGAEETTTTTTQPTTTTEPAFDPLAWAEDHVVGISSEGTFAEDAHAKLERRRLRREGLIGLLNDWE